jgi:hypothetical protein
VVQQLVRSVCKVRKAWVLFSAGVVQVVRALSGETCPSASGKNKWMSRMISPVLSSISGIALSSREDAEVGGRVKL